MSADRRRRARAPAELPSSTSILFGAIAVAPLLLSVALCGCDWGSIPAGRYGVTALEIRGARAMDERALAACLATHERSRFQIDLGTSPEPECGVPPFDADRVSIRLWRWPWTEWPLYDHTVFERDVERVRRWYRARGFYEARVLSSEVSQDDDERETSIVLNVAEGRATFVRSLRLLGQEQLDQELRETLQEALSLVPGDRFDEADYDRSKEVLLRALRDAGYAKARLAGRVTITPNARAADIELTITPGPECSFGAVTVEGNGELPSTPIVGAAGIDRGERYNQSLVEEAQRAIYALGAFSSVEVQPILDTPGSVIDLHVTVVPGRVFRVGFGLGIQAGLVPTQALSEQTQSVNEWDVHALAILEHRNFLGGLRRLRIEERPRLIFRQQFPNVTTPRLGNRVSVEGRQPAFLEARTTLVANVTYDVGPDPFEDFSRHSVDAWIGPRRTFLDGRLLLSVAIHDGLFIPFAVGTTTSPVVQYNNLFWEQFVRLDLRDDPREPRNGAYFGLGMQESGYLLPSSWQYLRFTPEASGYVGLPLGMVLAARFALGIMHVYGTSLDPLSALGELGPFNYRLRGGGGNSVRGVLAGRLGDGVEGGLRRWEASLELRLPITASFGIVVFLDAGDVSREEVFRFNRPSTSLGFGLRYKTIVGPLRLDFGWRIPGLQRFGDAPPPSSASQTTVDLGLFQYPGAFHVTIGEAF